MRSAKTYLSIIIYLLWKIVVYICLCALSLKSYTNLVIFPLPLYHLIFLSLLSVLLILITSLFLSLVLISLPTLSCFVLLNYVCVLALETLHENTLCSFFTEFIVLCRPFLCWQALLERLIHGFLKLRVLVRTLYGIVGVSPNPCRDMSSLSLTCTVSQSYGNGICLS